MACSCQTHERLKYLQMHSSTVMCVRCKCAVRPSGCVCFVFRSPTCIHWQLQSVILCARPMTDELHSLSMKQQQQGVGVTISLRLVRTVSRDWSLCRGAFCVSAPRMVSRSGIPYYTHFNHWHTALFVRGLRDTLHSLDTLRSAPVIYTSLPSAFRSVYDFSFRVAGVPF